MYIDKISSPQNEKFKYWKTLREGSGLKKSTDFILSGEKIIHEFLSAHPNESFTLLSTDKQQINLERLTKERHSKLLVFNLSQTLFDELDVVGTHSPLLVAKQPLINTWNPAHITEGLEVLCPLGDPLNLGALARSAEAFGINRLVLLSECVHPFHPKALKASAGSLLRLPLAWGPSIKNLAGEIYALDMNGTDINSFNWPNHLRLLIGEEGPGLGNYHFHIKKLKIPMNKSVESLNATVAASLAFYSYYLHNQKSVQQPI